MSKAELIKVLLVEDDPDDAMIVKDILDESSGSRLIYLLEQVTRLAAGFEYLARETPDLILLDLNLPDSRGLETVERMHAGFPGIPIVVLTGLADDEAGLAAVRKGAQDYLVKGEFDRNLLVRILNYAIERKKIEEELRQRNIELSALYKISAAVNMTMELQDLYAEIIDVITEIKFLAFERDIVIFLAEDDRLRVVYDTRPELIRGKCPTEIKIGTCLCGLAARSGEIIVSENCFRDSRHTIHYEGMRPHGHVIIPLQAKNRLVGVLCLYSTIAPLIGERRKELLQIIGNQVGLAIENAGLFEKTKELALHDPLTGLANRRLLDILLERNFFRGARYNTPFSIIMADIDFFKKYNDTHGHQAGDALLADIAGIISKEMREIDLVVRYGGEEFLILLPGSEIDEAQAAAERIRKSVETGLDVTLSLGVAGFRQGMIKDDIVKSADSALYRAKEAGRNQVVVSEDATKA